MKSLKQELVIKQESQIKKEKKKNKSIKQKRSSLDSYESSLTLRIKKESISFVQSKVKIFSFILQIKIESLSLLYYRTISRSSSEFSKLEDLHVGSSYKSEEEEKEEEDVIDVARPENDSSTDSPTHHTRHVTIRKEKRLK